jgi:Pyruvate/2-oxoacid:ferredoxin oxidoreductase delta subunit
MKLGAPDDSGRARPVPIEGSEFTMIVDTVIKAIGETAVIELDGQKAPDKTKGELDVLHNGNLFVGGDAATGPSSVAEAARSGREVAWAILKLLDPDSAVKRVLPTEPIPASGINTEYFQNKERAQSNELPATSRTENFSEVLQGLSLQTALMEARRCFSCGACDHCDTCWVFCPDNAIKRIDGEYQIDLDTCKGCGICAQECPRGVVSLVQEIQ